MVKQVIVVLVCMVGLGYTTAKAGTTDSDDTIGESKVRLSVTGELNSADAWRLETGCHWFPVSYVGLGGSLGLWKQYSSTWVPNGQFWCIDEDSKRTQNLFVQPSVVLFSPDIFRKSDYAIRLYGELGAMINIPYDKACIDIFQNEYRIPESYEYISSNKGEWCFFDSKIGLSLRVEYVAITIGYSYSTLDVYAQRRTMRYNNEGFARFYPRNKGTHGAFLSILIGL